ncbi:family 78 glycoside hydrolase catalytic domain [Cohnella soli]|uniref:alpha-L-rhamnosidase n=1 Tax=Cohnella soli TaxID=425005 RepID=A0ABW0HYU3_9BACL
MRNETFNVINPRVENSSNPYLVDRLKPIFGWGFESDRRNVRQSAYQIIVASSESLLEPGKADVWDSGKAESNINAGVDYGGIPLQSAKRYYWKVRVWDAEDQPTSFSETGTWEMALLNREDWKAQWIGVTERDIRRWKEESGGSEQATAPLPLLRTHFRMEKMVTRAKAYICGLGHYELRLNGERVGESALDPGWTNYDKTCLYAAFDVRPHLRVGDNAIGVMLGNGFYNVEGGRYEKYTGSFGTPKMIMQLEVEYADGTTGRIVSGEGWRISRSPITFSCIYGGEDYDARLEQVGWDQLGFHEDHRWQLAQLVEEPKGQLRAQIHPPNKVMRRYKPVLVHAISSGRYVYDFGQNFSGWIRIGIQGPRGAEVKFVYDELLDDQGEVKQRWTGGPSYFSYTLKGEGEEIWTPRFSYSGFRYIQVDGAVPQSASGEPADERMPTLLHIEGQMIHADVADTGGFSCSNDMWNRIHGIINMAILSNMKSVLTDCPHREKLGWLEQTQLMGPAVMLNYDVPNLYRKIIADMSEAQLDSGLVPDIAPEYTVFEDGFRDSAEFGGAYIIASWYVYRRYRDRQLLESHYEGMKRYLANLTDRSDEYILNFGLGDWCDVGPNPGFPHNTPIALAETATYYYATVLMSRIARVLGREDDSHSFVDLAARIQESFIAEFHDPIGGHYGTGSQTSNAMPLALGLVPKRLEAAVLDNLLRDIRERDYKFTSGEIGFRYVLMALTQHRQAETVARMLLRTDDPSYGYQILQGATTLTEAWNGPTFGLSQNHFMQGHAEQWFYAGLAGIRLNDEDDDHNRIDIAPQPVDGIQWARAHHRMAAGIVESHWQFDDSSTWKFKIAIPANVTAVVTIPFSDVSAMTENGLPIRESQDIVVLREEETAVVLEVGSGNYLFEVRIL